MEKKNKNTLNLNYVDNSDYLDNLDNLNIINDLNNKNGIKALDFDSVSSFGTIESLNVSKKNYEPIKANIAKSDDNFYTKVTNSYFYGADADGTSNAVLGFQDFEDFMTVKNSVDSIIIKDEKLNRNLYYEQDPNYWQDDIILEDKKIEYKYRLHLNKNSEICFIKYPIKLENLTNLELLNHKEVTTVTNLPKNTKFNNKNNIIENNIKLDNFDLNTFNLNNIKLFSPIDKKVYYDILKNITLLTTDSFKKKINNNKCPIGVNIFDQEKPRINNNVLNEYITTGNIVNDSIEVVCINLKSKNNGIMWHYFDKSKFSLSYISYFNFRVNKGTFKYLNYFIKIKIKTVDHSISLFGNKTAKTKLLNQIYEMNDFVILTDYYSAKLKNKIEIIQINTSNTKDRNKWMKFDVNDIEFLLIDSSKLTKSKNKNKINYTKGMQVKIVNDRRLINFKKGDILTLDSLKKNNNNLLNSKIVVKNDKNLTETLLLKQIKPYGKQDIKKEEIIEVKKIDIDRLKRQQVQIAEQYQQVRDGEYKARLAKQHQEVTSKIKEYTNSQKNNTKDLNSF